MQRRRKRDSQPGAKIQNKTKKTPMKQTQENMLNQETRILNDCYSTPYYLLYSGREFKVEDRVGKKVGISSEKIKL